VSWVSENLNLLVVLIGLGFVYVGAWHFSIGAANLLLGTILAGVGLTPYVRRLWRR